MLVAEVCRPSPSATSNDVAKLAADYVAWGVDAIAVATDLEETPGGLQDLFAVCRAVKVPVLQWDWFLHPLQASRLYAATCQIAATLQLLAGHATSHLLQVTDALHSFARHKFCWHPHEISWGISLTVYGRIRMPADN